MLFYRIYISIQFPIFYVVHVNMKNQFPFHNNSTAKSPKDLFEYNAYLRLCRINVFHIFVI